MLIIRTAQMGAFQRAIDEQFVGTLAALVRARCPSHPLVRDETALDGALRHCIHAAQAHGLTRGDAIADYVGLKFEVGMTFDDCPVVRAGLAGELLDANRKFRNLLMTLPESQWQQVRLFCAQPHARKA